jgi:hypothetical protein
LFLPLTLDRFSFTGKGRCRRCSTGGDACFDCLWQGCAAAAFCVRMGSTAVVIGICSGGQKSFSLSPLFRLSLFFFFFLFFFAFDFFNLCLCLIVDYGG